MNAIEMNGLTKTFRGKRLAVVEALKAVSMVIGRGEVFGFLGPNGAGKSTTIKILTGQIRATAGSASVFSLPVGSSSARRNVGYLPENPSFFEFLSAREYLHFIGKSYKMDRASIKDRSGVVLEQLGLEQSADRRIRGYSKGMVQRLGLAQALLHDPDLYILDEPMSGLDPVGRALVKDIMLDLKRRGKTVFFSTHIISDVEAICDRVAVIAKGELRAENLVSELLEKSVEGYRVSLDKIPQAGFEAFRAAGDGAEKNVFYVPSAELNKFMHLVDEQGCVIRLIEPCRKNLESFFLKAIA